MSAAEARDGQMAELDSVAGDEAEDVRAICVLGSRGAEMAAPVGIVLVLLDFFRWNTNPPTVFTTLGKPDAVFVAGFGRIAVVLTTAG